ncbi:MAG: TetR/AcrR family transcriptional regulator [Clostridiales bacterium]|nr:TetR/AcrR family transcriptional regulator [Clostridiales bacterium]
MNAKTFDRKDQLITAALTEFIEKDYEKASLNTIIKNANLSKGVFYYHFKSKEALYIALLEDATKKKWHYISTHTDTTDYTALDIFDRFVYQARASVQFAHEFPVYHKLGRMFLKEKGNPIYWTALQHIEATGTDVLDEMIRDAYQNGEINTAYPIEFTVKLLRHLFLEFESIFIHDIDYELDNISDLLKTYVSFMRHGLNP